MTRINRITSRLIRQFAALCLIGAAQTSSGASVSWTNWTTASDGLQGSASGTFSVGRTISVSYSGDVSFAQTNNTGTNWWIPASTYSGSIVSNAPSTSDIIALTGGNSSLVNTITFSAPVTDPIMTVFSLGSPTITAEFTFNAPFTILSSGPSAYYGFVSLNELPGNVLQGNEGNGTIEFLGTYSSISWTNPDYENWYGFTIGAFTPQAVPEPSSVVLMFVGGCGIFHLWRRRNALISGGKSELH